MSSPQITIISPGENDILSSPIKLSAEITPDPNGLIRVTLTSRNGDLLARQLLKVETTSSTTPVPFDTALAFEIPSDQTEALLTIAVQDEVFRTIAIRSALVTLTSSGETKIQLADARQPWLEIAQPNPNEDVSGGEIVVTGSVTPISNRPITVELTSDNGRVLGVTQLAAETIGELMDFSVTLYYGYITELTDVLLVIHQSHYPYNEIAILDSLPLTADP